MSNTYILFTAQGVEQLGSDAWCPVDGRFGIPRICDEARALMQRKKAVQPSYDGFKIVRGSIRQHRCVYETPKPIKQT